MVSTVSLNTTTPLRLSNNKPAFKGYVYDDAKAAQGGQEAVAPKDKFSIKDAGDYYWQGFTSPIHQLLKHPAIMGATIAGGVALKRLTKDFPRISLFSLAGTVGIAAFNFGKGVYKFAKSEDVNEKEKSFYNMGQGTVYGAFALMPAKYVAKANNDIIPNADKLNSFQALGACLAKTPKALFTTGKAVLDGKGLASALGAGGVVSGTEAFAPEVADVPDIPGGAPLDDNMAVFREFQESMPEQFNQAAEALQSALNDDTGGFTVAINTQGDPD